MHFQPVKFVKWKSNFARAGAMAGSNIASCAGNRFAVRPCAGISNFLSGNWSARGRHRAFLVCGLYDQMAREDCSPWLILSTYKLLVLGYQKRFSCVFMDMNERCLFRAICSCLTRPSSLTSSVSSFLPLLRLRRRDFDFFADGSSHLQLSLSVAALHLYQRRKERRNGALSVWSGKCFTVGFFFVFSCCLSTRFDIWLCR